ncbi:WXG100 family type VII secretion target [Streptacidiphilus neutrinimicus]|uniref:WXG100 family type VII secretion target n=1 Tax=Streptacidiphilus neutrinimicus TaxID=105420 RepID=UPI001269DB80|nr:PPE domain-containing protein [Streptacidiphilus neutrinimicus]
MRAMLAGSNPETLDRVAAKWEAIDLALQQAQEDLLHHTRATTTHWAGTAADAFTARATELHQAIGHGATYASHACSGVSYAADALRAARLEMPPEPASLEDRVTSEQARTTGTATDALHEQQRQHAVAVMERLEQRYAAAAEMIGTPGRCQRSEDLGAFPDGHENVRSAPSAAPTAPGDLSMKSAGAFKPSGDSAHAALASSGIGDFQQAQLGGVKFDPATTSPDATPLWGSPTATLEGRNIVTPASTQPNTPTQALISGESNLGGRAVELSSVNHLSSVFDEYPPTGRASTPGKQAGIDWHFGQTPTPNVPLQGSRGPNTTTERRSSLRPPAPLQGNWTNAAPNESSGSVAFGTAARSASTFQESSSASLTGPGTQFLAVSPARRRRRGSRPPFLLEDVNWWASDVKANPPVID